MRSSMDLLELGAWMVLTSVWSRVYSVRDSMLKTRTLALKLGQPMYVKNRSDVNVRQIERQAYSWKSVLFWTDCMDRALATRLWLARTGQPSEIVVGFRSVNRPVKEGAMVEGHAWVECLCSAHIATIITLFMDEESGYQEVFRESSLVNQESTIATTTARGS